MKTPHTPGPWVFTQENGYMEIKDGDGKTLQSNECYYPYNSENEADWHLQAAAPEMFETLSQTLRQLVELMFQFGPQIWSDKRQIIYEAISKAEEVLKKAQP